MARANGVSFVRSHRVLDILHGCQDRPLLSGGDQARLVELVAAAEAPSWDRIVGVQRAPGPVEVRS